MARCSRATIRCSTLSTTVEKLERKEVRLSSEYPESDAFRASPPQHRALVLALLDLGIEIDTEGQAAAALIGINQTDLICLNALFRQGAMTAGQLATTNPTPATAAASSSRPPGTAPTRPSASSTTSWNGPPSSQPATATTSSPSCWSCWSASAP
jgi:hypothetical protein